MFAEGLLFNQPRRTLAQLTAVSQGRGPQCLASDRCLSAMWQSPQDCSTETCFPTFLPCCPSREVPTSQPQSPCPFGLPYHSSRALTGPRVKQAIEWGLASADKYSRQGDYNWKLNSPYGCCKTGVEKTKPAGSIRNQSQWPPCVIRGNNTSIWYFLWGVMTLTLVASVRTRTGLLIQEKKERNTWTLPLGIHIEKGRSGQGDRLISEEIWLMH